MQLKQLTHLEISTWGLRKSIHEDLHRIAHLPHLVQALSLNLILKSDILEIRPRNVPTGQNILQYRRPLVKERAPTRRKNAVGIEYTISGNPLTGTLLSV
jgi:hypothetical protein